MDITIYNDTIQRYINTAQSEIEYIYRDVASGIDKASFGGKWYGKRVDSMYDSNRGLQGAGMAITTVCADADCGWDEAILAVLNRDISFARKSKEGYYTSYRIFRADLVEFLISRGGQMLVNHKKIYAKATTDKIQTVDDSTEELSQQDIQSYKKWEEDENNDSDIDFLYELVATAQEAAHTRIAKERIERFMTDIINGNDDTVEFRKNKKYLTEKGYLKKIQEVLSADARVHSMMVKRRKLNAMAEADAEMKRMKKNKQ